MSDPIAGGKAQKAAKNPPQNIMDEYNRRSAHHRGLICESLRAAGHTTDGDGLIVDGQYVGLFVIPGADRVFIGFGLLGGRTAYRGSDKTVPHEAIANHIARYVSEQRSPLCGGDPAGASGGTSKSMVDLAAIHRS